MRKKEKLVFGVGVNDYEETIQYLGKPIRSYRTWQSMIKRCYDNKHRSVKDNSYVGCTVANEWLSYKNFKDWFDNNFPTDIVFNGIEVEIDKDLLVEGNKVYSPETCIFIPRKINSFMTNKKSNNTSGYTGVSKHSQTNKWYSRIREFETSKIKHLGIFEDIEDASKAYQKAREAQCEKAKAWLRELGYEENIIEKIR